MTTISGGADAHDPDQPALCSTSVARNGGSRQEIQRQGFTFIGYEIVIYNVEGDNLHRVVIFRDGKHKVDPDLPFSATDSSDPAKLWQVLAGYEEKTGGEVLAIPHNGNLSNGLMFAFADFVGNPLTRNTSRPRRDGSRSRGDADEGRRRDASLPLAERRVRRLRDWDKGNLDLTRARSRRCCSSNMHARPSRTVSSSTQQLGVNPFKFGMIGSTDAHTCLAAVEEDNFFGKLPAEEPSSAPMHPFATGPDAAKLFGWEDDFLRLRGACGRARTRAEALLDAMQRKEVYGTTGSTHDRTLLRRLGLRGARRADA